MAMNIYHLSEAIKELCSDAVPLPFGICSYCMRSEEGRVLLVLGVSQAKFEKVLVLTGEVPDEFFGDCSFKDCSSAKYAVEVRQADKKELPADPTKGGACYRIELLIPIPTICGKMRFGRSGKFKIVETPLSRHTVC
jgi:hypothetical protein